MTIPMQRFRDWLLVKHDGFTMQQLKDQFKDVQDFNTFQKAIEAEYSLVCMGDYYEAFSLQDLERR
jgi:hypothetical protein